MKYGDKVVDFGNELTPRMTEKIPEIRYKHEGGVLYTLVMTGKLKHVWRPEPIYSFPLQLATTFTVSMRINLFLSFTVSVSFWFFICRQLLLIGRRFHVDIGRSVVVAGKK